MVASFLTFALYHLMDSFIVVWLGTEYVLSLIHISVLNKIGSTGMVPVFYHKDAEVARCV